MRSAKWKWGKWEIMEMEMGTVKVRTFETQKEKGKGTERGGGGEGGKQVEGTHLCNCSWCSRVLLVNCSLYSVCLILASSANLLKSS